MKLFVLTLFLMMAFTNDSLAMRAEPGAQTGTLVPAILTPTTTNRHSATGRTQSNADRPSNVEMYAFLVDAGGGNLEQVKRFVETYPTYINDHTYGYCPALHWAASFYVNKGGDNRLAVCDYLLGEGALFAECPRNSKNLGGCAIGYLKIHGHNILNLAYYKDHPFMKNLHDVVAKHRVMRNATMNSSGSGSVAKPAGATTQASAPRQTGPRTQASTPKPTKPAVAKGIQVPIPSASVPNRGGPAPEGWLSKNKALFATLSVAALGIGYWLWQESQKTEDKKKPDSEDKKEKETEENKSDETKSAETL